MDHVLTKKSIQFPAMKRCIDPEQLTSERKLPFYSEYVRENEIN
jgi:hypothetical protein